MNVIKNKPMVRDVLSTPKQVDKIQNYASRLQHIESLPHEGVAILMEHRNATLNKGLEKIPDEVLSLIFENFLLSNATRRRERDSESCNYAITR